MPSQVDGRVVCPECGPVVAPAGEFLCELDTGGERGICELRCPVCTVTLIVPAKPEVVETLHRAGAGHLTLAPFELLEPHAGPPLSWDDVLDFKLALETLLTASGDERP